MTRVSRFKTRQTPSNMQVARLWIKPGLKPLKDIRSVRVGLPIRPASKRILLAGRRGGDGRKIAGRRCLFRRQKRAAGCRNPSWHQNIMPGICWKIFTGISSRSVQAGFEVVHAIRFKMLPVSDCHAISLKALSFPFIHQWFSKGYTEGKTLSQILYG